MVRLFVVLGFALLAGGAYAIVDGWPYRVLERGFTEVILGGLAVVAGLILLALAAVLAEIRRLKGLVSGAMAAMTLSEARPQDLPLPGETHPRPELPLENEPASAPERTGIATTLAAGAGAAAVAGALTGLAKAGEPPDEAALGEAGEADKAEESEPSSPGDVEAVVAEPSQSPSVEAGATDDWLLPPPAPVLDAAPSDVRPDERGEDDEESEADGKVETSEEDENRSISADAREESPLHDREGDVAQPMPLPEGEPGAGLPEDDKDGAKQEAASESPAEDRLWWPRIDRPVRVEAGSVDDEFSALRDQLVGAVNAPEIEPPRRDRDVLDTVEGWTAPRPWPPVTQPRDPGALADTEADGADKALPEDGKAEPAPGPSEAVAPAPGPEQSEEPTPEPAAAEAETPLADKALAADIKPDEEPAASDEGVIGAYQVGETQFTMFADGSIHARTPDGDYTFASMDELKAYLASEKDKLETSSS